MNLDKDKNVHNGRGIIEITHMINGNESKNIRFMHDDILEPKAEIGEHKHTKSEELYFIIEGNGTLILDGESYQVKSGDISLCKKGHSHGLKNGEEKTLRLLVIGLKK